MKLYQRCGQHDWLLHKLQEKKIPNEIEVVSHDEALKTFGEDLLFEYALGLEKQFPPGIAFTDVIEGQPELQRDFSRNKKLLFFGVAKYKVDDTAREIYRDVYEEELKEDVLPTIVGYAMGINVSRIPELREMKIGRYMSSVITDHRFRTKGVAPEMVRPILDEFDSSGTNSFLTAWCHNGIKMHHSYYPPVIFWHREGYEFLDAEPIRKITSGIKRMHNQEGIFGRNYSVKEVKVGDLEMLKRYDEFDPERRIGILESYYEPIGYGEKRWDGVVMLREPKQRKS